MTSSSGPTLVRIRVGQKHHVYSTCPAHEDSESPTQVYLLQAPAPGPCYDGCHVPRTPCDDECRVSQAPYSDECHVPRAQCNDECHVPRAPCNDECSVSQAPYNDECHVPRAPWNDECHVPRAPWNDECRVPRAPCNDECSVPRAPCNDECSVPRAPCNDECSVPQTPCSDVCGPPQTPCCDVCSAKSPYVAFADYRPGQVVSRRFRLHLIIEDGRSMRDVDIVTLQNLLGKYVCSLLNTVDGGIIDYGVNALGVVSGFWCSRRTKNKIRLSLDNALAQCIEPRVLADVYTIRFIPVRHNPRWTTGYRVMEIEVCPPNLRGSYRFLYKNVCYVVDRDRRVPIPLEWRCRRRLPKGCAKACESACPTKRDKMARLEQNINALSSFVSYLSQTLDTYVRRHNSGC